MSTTAANIAREDDNINRRLWRLGGVSALFLSLLPATPLLAFPFPVVDARTAAMGGVSVASDFSVSPFANPALAAQNVENTDWLLEFPAQADLKSDSDAFEAKLSAPVAEYEGDTHGLFQSNSFAMIVPGATFGGFVYYNDRLYHSAEIRFADQVLRHRAVNVTENGFGLARTMEEPNLPLYGFMVGASAKLVTYRAFGYDEGLVSQPGITLDQSKYSSPSSAINFDFGLARELGVWKMGLVVRDIFNFDQDYSNSGDVYRVTPQTRMGISYHSRNTFWEVDIDLSKNTDVASESESQYMAFGWEYRIIKPLTLRLGYNNNSVGDQLQTTSAGVGLNIGMFQLDFATLKNDHESGTYTQLSMKF